MLVTVDQVVQGDDLKVVVTSKKIYRSAGLTRKELRGQVSLHVRNGRSCNCIRALIKSSGGNITYLAIGNRSATADGKLILTLLKRADQKTGEVQRAIRTIANDTECRNGKHVIDLAGGQNPEEGKAGKSTSRTITAKVPCRKGHRCRRSTPTPAHQAITSSTLELNRPDVTTRSDRRKPGRMSTAAATTAGYIINPTISPGNDGTSVAAPGKDRKRKSTISTVTASTTLVPTRSGANSGRRRTTEKAVTN